MVATTQSTAAEPSSAEPIPQGLRQLGVRDPLKVYLRDLWARRDFAIQIPLGDLRAEHMDTFFGQVWHLLNPALLTGVYFLVFGMILHAHRGIDHFLVFLTIGILMFQYTQRAATTGASTIATSEELLRSIQFPRTLLPISSLVFETVAFLPAVFVMLFVAIASGVFPTVDWLILLPVLVIQILFNFGLILIVARLADRYRDVQQVLPFIFRILLYLSGILFSVDRYVHSRIGRQLFCLNPIYSIISLARGAILGTPVGQTMWLSVLGWTAFLLAGGFMFFRAAERSYGRG